jgi:hypothetical protein
MTRLWPAGDSIQIRAGPDGLPQAFFWRETWHPVAAIANRWRVRATWWSVEAWREYFRLTTTDGLLCTLYCDLRTGEWFCSRLYD